jgi:CxxC motif-containing protein (DUF1111 family)
LAVLACGEDPAPSADDPSSDAYSGGATTVFNATSTAYEQPAPNLSAASFMRHVDGDAVFEQVFVTAPADRFAGLGPAFNESSCAGCHVHNGRGRNSGLVRVSLAGMDSTGGPLAVPGLGKQVQDRAVFGRQPEALVSVHYEETAGAFDDGTPYSLRRPIVELTPTSGSLPSGVQYSRRVAPPVFGLGLLEAVPEETLALLASAPDGPGISGRMNLVWDDLRATRVLGRFGWKANEPTLRQQSAHAYQQDIGVTSPDAPTESTRGQMEFDDGLDDDPEIDGETLSLATFYVQTLGVPARRNLSDPRVREGARLFTEVGCSGCHVDELVTGAYPDVPELSQQIIHPYTDLLLHDMGEGLSDDRPDFSAAGSEWRTPPLWGIGLLEAVNGHLELLHDGRARGFLEAILWHGGEAAESTERVLAMTEEERNALIVFLRSL